MINLFLSARGGGGLLNLFMFVSTLRRWCSRAGRAGCATSRRLTARSGTVLCYRQRGAGNEQRRDNRQIFQSCHNAPSCLSRPCRSKRLWVSLVPVPAVVYRDDPAAQGAQRPTVRCCYRLTDSIMSAAIR
jgi:hypothetical protein